MLIFLAFLITLLITGGAIWAARYFKKVRTRRDNERGQRQRLSVIDAAAVNERRQLILIRRDNVEHLLLIGGPTDVVIEPNIVRAAAATREPLAPLRAPATTNTLPPAVPLGDAGMWPLHQKLASLARAQREPTPKESAQWPIEAELPPLQSLRRTSRQGDPLIDFAGEAARLPEPSRGSMPPDLSAPSGIFPSEPQIEPVHEHQAIPEREPIPYRASIRDREQTHERKAGHLQSPLAAAEAEFQVSAAPNLTDMVQRLEAALGRPAKPDEARPAQPVPPATTRDMESAPNPRAAVPSASRPSTTRVEPKSAKTFYDSLDREFEELLGRPAVTDNLTSNATTASAAPPIEKRAVQSPPVQSSDTVEP
jgi:flagellar protein FliO/FliZ